MPTRFRRKQLERRRVALKGIDDDVCAEKHQRRTFAPTGSGGSAFRPLSSL
jgi:hypothetical protein